MHLGIEESNALSDLSQRLLYASSTISRSLCHAPCGLTRASPDPCVA